MDTKTKYLCIVICPKKFTLAHNLFEVTELCRTRADIRGCQHRQRVRVLERDHRFCVLRIRSAHLHVFKSSCQVALRRVLTKNSKWVERLGRAGFQR